MFANRLVGSLYVPYVIYLAVRTTRAITIVEGRSTTNTKMGGRPSKTVYMWLYIHIHIYIYVYMSLYMYVCRYVILNYLEYITKSMKQTDRSVDMSVFYIFSALRTCFLGCARPECNHRFRSKVSVEGAPLCTACSWGRQDQAHSACWELSPMQMHSSSAVLPSSNP